MTTNVQQYTELAELAGGFVHELKNHLGTLNLHLQLLAEDFSEPQNHRERRAANRIHKLQAECRRMTDVSNDFLRFVRMAAIERQPTRLEDVVADMVDFFMPTARAANIEIRSFIPSDLPDVFLSVDLFKQALLNLMLNAEQAMPQGGEMTLTAHVEPNAVCLSLIDTGCGIPSDVLPKIFKPFFTTKTSGNGLGLPTVRRIIEAHDGTIEVQSEVDRGTKFTIRLPVIIPTQIESAHHSHT